MTQVEEKNIACVHTGAPYSCIILKDVHISLLKYVGGARARHLGHEPLSPRALSQFRRGGSWRKNISVRGRLSGRGEGLSTRRCRPDTETTNPLEAPQMDTLQEPGHPPVTKIKWKHPEGSSQEETKGTVAIKTEDTEVCITEMEMRHQPRCPSPMCMSESTSHEEQEEEADFDINTDIIEVIEIKQEPQSPGLVNSHTGTSHQKQNNEASLEMLPGNQGHMVEFVGLLNGEKVYKLPTSNSTCTYDVPHLKNNQPRKRNKVQEQLEKNRPYIKKPLNAFMVFMREQRPHIDEEVKRKGNGVVNMHLAQKWKMMTKEQQAIYYQEAERQRQLHKQLFPEWSNGDNYGRKLYQEEKRRVSTKSKGTRGMDRSSEPQWTRAAHNNDTSVVKLSANQEHILNFVGLLNGEKVYKLSTGNSSSSFDFDRFNTSQPRKKNKVREQVEEKWPNTEKAKGTFGVSLEEQRPSANTAVQCSTIGKMHLTQKGKEARLKDLKAEVAEVHVTEMKTKEDSPSCPVQAHSTSLSREQNSSPPGAKMHEDQGLLLEMLRKRSKVQEEVEGGQPYVKKPLNAFMVFMKEQRPYIDLELKSKGNGVVNMYLAQKWKTMTKEQQAIYYEEADRQRQLHKQLYPEWSNRQNYGTKRKTRKQRKLISNTWTEVTEVPGREVPTPQNAQVTSQLRASEAPQPLMKSEHLQPTVVQLTIPQNPACDVTCLKAAGPGFSLPQSQILPMTAEPTEGTSHLPLTAKDPQSSQPTVIQLTFPQNPGNLLVCMLPNLPSGWTPNFK
ncbi:uncharacterized protein isoform X7 [Takifugu rubripes]|uniref:uncharacterized protein isoform X7 n=1 Tax=Takifugu rubripes TaxID=31033 RepID=UPI0011457B36|nr:uncharacterized protein LOC105419230 isoform X7 [Takifugu rubripes]